MFASGIPTSSSGFFPRKGFSDTSSVNGYAVSISQSSTAHSSIMNFDPLQMPVQKVEESEMHQWREGHSFRWQERAHPTDCEVCYELCTEGIFVCDGPPHHPLECIDCRLSIKCTSSMFGCRHTTMFISRKFLSRSHSRGIPTMFR